MKNNNDIKTQLQDYWKEITKTQRLSILSMLLMHKKFPNWHPHFQGQNEISNECIVSWLEEVIAKEDFFMHSFVSKEFCS